MFDTVQVHEIILPLPLLLPKPIAGGTTTRSPKETVDLAAMLDLLKVDPKLDYVFDDLYLTPAACKKQSAALAANEKPANAHFSDTACRGVYVSCTRYCFLLQLLEAWCENKVISGALQRVSVVLNGPDNGWVNFRSFEWIGVRQRCITVICRPLLLLILRSSAQTGMLQIPLSWPHARNLAMMTTCLVASITRIQLCSCLFNMPVVAIRRVVNLFRLLAPQEI
jgi:hypothetical protein